ncbi:MAG TPA: enoyl-CoA hydratase-related protein [Burkholderiales bacterium]|nr:enoyl-CoA hydratase-related protein [Burkholderiales bacterium]
MTVLFSVENHIATVVLNRPESMNAIDPDMRRELIATWQRVREDDDVLVVVVTGAGDKAFCTGADLKKTLPSNESFAQETFARAAPVSPVAHMEMDKPIIAAINGYAMGGGMEIALACDIRIASDNAQFALSEARVGSIPGSGGTQRLPRAIGMSDAMLMLLTAERIDAQEALRMGLVSRVVPRDQLMPAALDIAGKIAANAPLAVRAIKRLAKRGMDMPLQQAIDSERYVFGLLYQSEDRIEGRKAFAEKRKPQYKGR